MLVPRQMELTTYVTHPLQVRQHARFSVYCTLIYHAAFQTRRSVLRTLARTEEKLL